MKRPPLTILNALTTLSMLLCAITLALWVRTHRERGYRSIDALLLEHGWPEPYALHFNTLGILSVRGGIVFVRQREGVSTEGSWDRAEKWRYLNGRRLRWSHDFKYFDITGFSSSGPLMTYDRGMEQWYYCCINHLQAFAIPHWLTMIFFAALPAGRWTAGRLSSRKQASGLCAICGYDLRATPERCPECGTVPKPL